MCTVDCFWTCLTPHGRVCTGSSGLGCCVCRVCTVILIGTEPQLILHSAFCARIVVAGRPQPVHMRTSVAWRAALPLPRRAPSRRRVWPLQSCSRSLCRMSCGSVPLRITVYTRRTQHQTTLLPVQICPWGGRHAQKQSLGPAWARTVHMQNPRRHGCHTHAVPHAP